MKIILIDDANLNITLFKQVVRKLVDIECIGFTDPQQAIEWCRGNEPDLVVVDYMMPDINGIEFSKLFRGIPGYQDIPILMVTANNEYAVRIQALDSGVSDFLNKPLDNAEFIARTRNMLKLRKAHKQLADRAVSLAEEIRKARAEIIVREQETIFCLARTAEYRDPETGNHIHRMAYYCDHIASNLGFTREERELLLEAAPMHDIGKVGIPDMILLKPYKLTPEEFVIMRQHATIGFEVLNAGKSVLLKAAAQIAHTHHEKFDGSGYPLGLKGDCIPIFGRIVAVADVFDALTSERPYKKPWEIEKAKQFIRAGAGTHFDPVCVNAFLANWEKVLDIKNKYFDETVGDCDNYFDR